MPGDYPSDPWTFTDDGQLQRPPTAPSTTSSTRPTRRSHVTPYNVTYDGNAHTATGTATGVGELDLSGSLTLSGTTHTNAGDYPADPWTFTNPRELHTTANGTVHDIIAKANATL